MRRIVHIMHRLVDVVVKGWSNQNYKFDVIKNDVLTISVRLKNLFTTTYCSNSMSTVTTYTMYVYVQ